MKRSIENWSRRGCRLAATLLAAAALGCATASPYDAGLDFEGINDETAFQLERGSADSVLVENGKGEKLYQVLPSGAGFAIQGAYGEDLGSVIPLTGRRGFAVRDATGREVYKLLIEEDGDFKVRNSQGQNLYVGKVRSYGFKVMNAADEVESRVKIRAGRVSIRDADGNKYLSANVDDPEPMAMAVLTLQDIPLSYAAGLSVALTRAAQAPEGAPEG